MTRSVEIRFPVDVEFPEGFEQKLDALLGEVCDLYEKQHPDRVMWLLGTGCKMLTNPFMVDEDHPMEFDDSVYEVVMEERERYDSEKQK
jgi:hypothetical protein